MLASQVRVPGVGVVDFVLGDRVILEVDGKPNHVDGFEFPADADADAARKAAASKRHKDLVRRARPRAGLRTRLGAGTGAMRAGEPIALRA